FTPRGTVWFRIPEGQANCGALSATSRTGPRAEDLCSSGQDCFRCFQSIGERRLDGAHIRPGIERFTRKEYTGAVRLSHRSLSSSRLRRVVGIGTARKRVIAPVDGPGGDEVPSDTVRRQLENLAK